MYHFDIAGARVDLDRALALAPENVDVLNFYGDFLLLVGDLRGAERMKRQAMALDPLAWVHPKDLGQILSEQKRSSEALAMLELGAATGYPGSMNQLLREQLTLKQFDAAGRTLDRLCLGANAEDAFCQRGRVSVLAATGKLVEARAAIDKYVQQHPPTLPRDFSALAAIYANYLNDIPRASQAARKSLEGGSLLIPLMMTGRGALLPEEISQDPEWLAVWADPKLRELMAEYRKHLSVFRKGG
jgi:tetratricopeptide (TPR) repeat protein